MSDYGCQNMAGKMTRVLMRRPAQSLRNADPKQWHYNHLFDAEQAIEEYEAFVGLIETSGADIVWIPDDNDDLADAMFTRDASLITKAGAILLNMGKPLRAEEPQLHGKILTQAGIPVLGHLSGDARIEGGDIIWLDENTLIVGLGFRSNRTGVEVLQTLLNPHGVEVLGFDMPYWTGEAACLHLMSVISPLTETKYLVHPPLIPAALWTLMKSRGIDMVIAPADEFEASFGLNLNVLPTQPDRCIMIDGFPKTKAVMEAHGTHVDVFPGNALCMACEGGPTCLTNPVMRQAIQERY